MSELSIADVEDGSGKQEPTPGDKKTKRGRPPGSTSKRKETFVKEFQAELDAMLSMVAMLWSVRDPVCGGALNETTATIAQDLAELAGSSTKARKYLENTMGLGKIVPLAMHIMPLLATIREHHLTPNSASEDDTHGGPGSVV